MSTGEPLAEAGVRISHGERSSLLGDQVLAHPSGCNPFLSPPVFLAMHRSALSLAHGLSFQSRFTTVCSIDCDMKQLLRRWDPEGSTSKMQVWRVRELVLVPRGQSSSESAAGLTCPIYGHLHVKLL